MTAISLYMFFCMCYINMCVVMATGDVAGQLDREHPGSYQVCHVESNIEIKGIV